MIDGWADIIGKYMIYGWADGIYMNLFMSHCTDNKVDLGILINIPITIPCKLLIQLYF